MEVDFRPPFVRTKPQKEEDEDDDGDDDGEYVVYFSHAITLSSRLPLSPHEGGHLSCTRATPRRSAEVRLSTTGRDPHKPVKLAS